MLEHFLETKHLLRFMVKNGEEMLEERQVETIYNKLAPSRVEFRLRWDDSHENMDMAKLEGEIWYVDYLQRIVLIDTPSSSGV